MWHRWPAMTNPIHEYQGYWMRSHSETRWASLMDSIGITWVYEPRLVKTRHGWYLPDFYLPGAGVYLEVKGPPPTQEEIDKGFDLQAATGCPVIFAWGDMQLGINRIEGGVLTSLRSFGTVNFSTYELSPLVESQLLRHQFNRFLRCGIKGAAPCATSLGDIVTSMIFDRFSRSEAEKERADRHKPLNKLKTSAHRQASKFEWAISTFMRKSPGPGVREVKHG